MRENDRREEDCRMHSALHAGPQFHVRLIGGGANDSDSFLIVGNFCSS